MKITVLLLITGILQVSASTYAQKVSINKKGMQLEQVLKLIRDQSGFNILIDVDLLKSTRKVSLNIKNYSAEAAVEAAIKNQNLQYELKDKLILIKAKEKHLLESLVDLFTPEVNVHGRILDENGNPLAGASVTIKGTNRSVITGVNGIFRMENIGEKATLIVSYTGYITFEIKADPNIKDIIMRISDAKLDQVQIIGYGTTTRRFNTGAVTTLKSEDIQNQSVTSPIQALQGLVTGLFIQQGSGMPGASSTVSLRGTNSFRSGTVPLYIIDGVPFDGNSLERTGAASADQGNGSTDPLNAINPQDIASIDVLKDADATSIYGARGANGVIVITTKYAKSGKTTISGTVFTGVSKIRKYVPVLSTAEYLDIRKKAFANDNITPTELNAPDLLLWDQNQNTNYQKYLMGNSANQTDANIALSGGTATSGLYLSGSYRKEGTVYPADFGYRRASLHAKAFQTSDNGKLKADFSVIYSNELNKMPAADIANITTTYPNNYPLYNPDGTLYFHPNFASNPLAILKNYAKNESKTLIMNAGLYYNVLSNLRLKVNLGQNTLSQDGINIYPNAASNPTLGFSGGGGGVYTSNTTTAYVAEPQVDYNANIWKGKLDVTAGGTYQFREYEQPYFIAAAMFPSDAMLENYAAGTIQYQTRSSSQYRFASVFGRAVYNWDSKYILSGTFRRDGSSRFGPGKQYGNFGSLGAAWLFTEEAFLKDAPVLSFGKLRGSFGTVGNDNIGEYAYLETYSSSQIPYGENPGFNPSNVANSALKWETTKKMELALELGFFKDKVMLNTTWYRNRSNDLLTYYPLSGQTGFTAILANLDAVVQNAGWELDLKLSPLNRPSISWNVGFNFSTSTNKLVSYPGLFDSSNSNRYAIGKSINSIILYQFSGFENGVAQVADLDGDGEISQGLNVNGKGDQIIAGTTDPKFYGGFYNTLKVGNFQLDVLLNFVKKLGFAPTSFPGLFQNQLSEVLDNRFTPSTTTNSPSYASHANYYVNSDAKLVDASFIRLRNVTFSYNLPTKWTAAMHIKNCRVFATGQNLFTITSYKGYDPETMQFNPIGYPTPLPAPVFPPLMTITGGIQFSL